jgi:hypothetical protein
MVYSVISGVPSVGKEAKVIALFVLVLVAIAVLLVGLL